MNDLGDTVLSPWDNDSVAVLEIFQADEANARHSCPNDHGQSVLLIPQNEGLVCPSCGHIQYWCRVADIAAGASIFDLLAPPVPDPDPPLDILAQEGGV